MAEHRAHHNGSASGAIRAADLLARFDTGSRSGGTRHRAGAALGLPALATSGGALPAPRLPVLPAAEFGRALLESLPRPSLPRPSLPSVQTGRTLIAAVSTGAVGVTAAIVATTGTGAVPAQPPTDVQLAGNPAASNSAPAPAAAAFALPTARPAEPAAAAAATGPVTGAGVVAQTQPTAVVPAPVTVAPTAVPTAVAPDTRAPVGLAPDLAEAADASAKAASKAAAKAAAVAAAAAEKAKKADPAPGAGSSAGARALAFAKSELGTPYRYGAAGPSAYDCSGLVMAAFKKAGVSLPRTSAAQSRVGTPVSRDQLKPGDLVFFYSPVSHVGIYLGGGKMVHASTSGEPVKISNIGSRKFHNARRI